MSQMKHAFNWSALGAAVLLSGCVNYVKDDITTTRQAEHIEKSKKYFISITPDPPSDTVFTVNIKKFENFDNKTYEIKVGKTYYVPYSGWHKLYEMPTGLFLLPVSMISHLGYFFCLGYWSYDFTWDVTCTAFTGLNPCINWELESRTVSEPTTASRKLLKSEKEVKNEFLAKAPVLLRAGVLQKNYTTDDFGNFQVHLLSRKHPEDVFFPLDRKIGFFPEKSETSARDIILTRDLVMKILNAREIINSYFTAPSGKKLFQTLKTLEASGFNKVAYELEMEELKKHQTDEYFLREYKENNTRK